MKALPTSKLLNCEGMIYVCLTLEHSLNKNEEKATVSHIKPVTKWLNLVCGISGLAWFSRHEVDGMRVHSYLTLPPNTIPRGAFVYQPPVNPGRTLSDGKMALIEATLGFLSLLRTKIAGTEAMRGAN